MTIAASPDDDDVKSKGSLHPKLYDIKNWMAVCTAG